MTKQIIAALALAFGSTVAFAADPAADKKQPAEHPPTKAMDKQTEGQKPGETTGAQTPATKAMDKAAAGQTEQDKAVSESKEATDKSKQVGKKTDKEQTAGKEADQGAAGKPGSDKGRDWSAIDKDKNHLVSAEEMEAWLKANPGPAAGSAGKEGKDTSKEPAAKEPAADKEKKQ
ncbi:MAG TPA: hypothetical protein VFH21_07205 [Burkholderiales bacterium]|nr:hypothetical protein [Burkholderiales bacterium]